MFPPLASFSSWKVTKSCKCNSVVAGGGSELQLVFCWCLCSTVLSVKYCRGWSSARFVTLLWRRAWVRITARLSSHQAWCWRVRQLHLTDSLCTFLVAAKYRATRLRLSYNLEILLQSFWSYICLIARLPLTASGWNSASGRYQEINSRGSL